MRSCFLRLFIHLLLITPLTAIAQDQQSACISTHFHHFYGPSDTVKVISVERLKRWSAWCKHGYNSQKLENAIHPCYKDTINNLRSQSNDYIAIGFEKSQQVKAYCRQQFWLETTSSNEESSTAVSY